MRTIHASEIIELFEMYRNHQNEANRACLAQTRVFLRFISEREYMVFLLYFIFCNTDNECFKIFFMKGGSYS